MRVEGGARVLLGTQIANVSSSWHLSRATANSSLTLDNHIYNEDDTSHDVFMGSIAGQTSPSSVIVLCGHVESETFMDELHAMAMERMTIHITAGDSLHLTWTALSPIDSTPTMLCQGTIKAIEEATKLMNEGRETRARSAQRRGQVPLSTLLTIQGVAHRMDFLQLASHIKPSSSRKLDLSLNTLTTVISALKPKSHLVPPFRDSHLTLWLKEALLKASYILFLGYLSPLPGDSAESMATLSFVSRQRSGQGGVKISAIFEPSQVSPTTHLHSSVQASHSPPQIPEALTLASTDSVPTFIDQGSQISAEEAETGDSALPRDSPSKGSPYDVIMFLRDELEATRRKIEQADAEAKLREEEAEALKEDREKRLSEALTLNQSLAHELDVKQQQLNEVSSTLADSLKARSELCIAHEDLKKEILNLQGRLLDSVSRVEKEESHLKQLGAQTTRSKLNESALQGQVLHLTKALDDSQKERLLLEASEGQAREDARIFLMNLEEVKLSLGLAEQDLRLGKQKIESLSAQVNSHSLQIKLMGEESEKLQRTLEAQRKSTVSAVNELKELEGSVSEFLQSIETAPVLESLWRRVKREHMDLLMQTPTDQIPKTTGKNQQRSLLRSVSSALTKEGNAAQDSISKLAAVERSLEDERQSSSDSRQQLGERMRLLEHEIRSSQHELQHSRHLLSIAEDEIVRRNEMLKGLNNDRELMRLQAKSALDSNNQDAVAAESLRSQLKAREDHLDRLWILALQAKSSLQSHFSDQAPSKEGYDWSNPSSFRAMELFLVEMHGLVGRLVSDNEELERREAEGRRDRDSLSQELNTVAALLSDSQKDRSGNMARVSLLESELTSLLSKLNDLSSTEKKLMSENQALKSDLLDLEKQMKHVDESRKGLLQELELISASASSWKDEAQRREEEAKERQRERIIERTEIERLENQSSALKREQQQSEASHLVLKARAEEAESQLDECRSRLASTTKSVQESVSRQQDATTRLALVETDARIKVSALEARLVSSEEALALAQTRLQEKTEEMDEWMRDVSEENESLQRELEKASEKKLQAESLVSSYETQLTEVKAFASQMARERDQLSEVDAVRENLQRQLDVIGRERERDKERERNLVKRVEELQGDLNSNHSERMRLSALLEAAKLEGMASRALSSRSR